jgi:hypothetical protein
LFQYGIDAEQKRMNYNENMTESPKLKMANLKRYRSVFVCGILVLLTIVYALGFLYEGVDKKLHKKKTSTDPGDYWKLDPKTHTYVSK